MEDRVKKPDLTPEAFEPSFTPPLMVEGRGQVRGLKEQQFDKEADRNPRNARHDRNSKVVASPERFFDRADTQLPKRFELDLTNGLDPHDAVPTLWKLVADDNQPARLFLSEAGEVVRLEVVDGILHQEEVTTDRLTQEIHRVARFTSTAKSGGIRSRACPAQLVREMRAVQRRHIPLPRLRQVANAPLVADETGRIVWENGYYADLGVFLWCDLALSAVPDDPTASDVRKALAILEEPLRDFPFVSQASRATAMAILITPFVRRLINGPTPLHLIEKSTPGTGATLLSDVLLTPAVGRAVQRLMPPKSEHEWEYSIAAVLRSLPAAIVIDNARDLTVPQLAKAVTDDVMVTRIVGSSEVASVPVLCVWVTTGNNPTLHQEIARRTIKCRLDAGVEQPWLREQFRIPDLKAWLHTNRSAMIWAALTLIRRWFANGQPRGRRTLGMFESYSQIIGGILSDVGVEGFLSPDALADATEGDLQTEAERWLATQWWARHKTSKVGVSDLLPLATHAESPILQLWGADAHSDS